MKTTSRTPHPVDEADLRAAERLAESYQQMTTQLSKVIVGQTEVLKQVLIALFCQGHCILEGVPGLAKTLMISSIAQLLSLSFKRIQFTPDLMPSDITGTEILEEEEGTGRRRMKFVKGPVFGNIILGDEINRTPPKTQAALLQAMQEYRVTTAGVDYNLDKPFLVLGTQNPIEQEGTYPLPEAQLDRFMFKVHIDYPTYEEEMLIAETTTAGDLPRIEPVLDRGGSAGLPGAAAGRQGPRATRRPNPCFDGGHPLCRRPGAAASPGGQLPGRQRRGEAGPPRRETVPDRPRTTGPLKKKNLNHRDTEDTEKRKAEKGRR
jgi:hypothetical protein